METLILNSTNFLRVTLSQYSKAVGLSPTLVVLHEFLVTFQLIAVDFLFSLTD